MIQPVVTGGEGLHLDEPVLASERQRVLVSQAFERARAALDREPAGARGARL